MLFRPFRLIFLLALAFAAGMVYENHREHQSCIGKAGLLAQSVCNN